MNKDELLEFVAKENEIPKEEIAAIYTDEKAEKRYVFKRNILIKQHQYETPIINKSFDEIYSEEFEKISSDYSEIVPIIFVGMQKSKHIDGELLNVCGNLLQNALNTIGSSVQTLRCGFRLQSSILLRTVIEICATVTHLVLKPEMLDNFKNDKIKSTYSISVANENIPIFGKAWGLLSNKQIHINSIHSDYYPLNIYSNKKEIPVNVTIGIIGIVTEILRITSELTFYSYLESHQYWNLEEENKLSFIPPNDINREWIKEIMNKE